MLVKLKMTGFLLPFLWCFVRKTFFFFFLPEDKVILEEIIIFFLSIGQLYWHRSEQLFPVPLQRHVHPSTHTVPGLLEMCNLTTL